MNLSEKIQKLSKKKIDELFYLCGWKDSKKGENKALPDWRIEEIKSGEGNEFIDSFIQETDREKIQKELMKVEGIAWPVFVKGNKITFTTDAPEFKKDLTIDNAIDRLNIKFGIDDFKINAHKHSGKKKDKDVSFTVKNKKNMEKIIEFIEEEFYGK